MNFQQPISVTTLAQKYSLLIKGNTHNLALGINEIHKVRKGDITFVDVEKYYLKSLNSQATIIIINKDVPCPEGKTLFITEDPFAIYNQIVWEQRPMQYLQSNMGENVSIGEDTHIDFGAYIGHDVTIGKGCYIQSGAYIGDHTVIGDQVNIQAGALIGTDAFYFKRINGKYQKWRSGGRVIIEDDAEIGAGCTINRGVSGDTIIGSGTKLDSQVHVGHGVVIGRDCLIAAQVGIAGKTIIGSNCVIYGQVGIAQNLKIGDNVIILAKSGISKNLESDKTYFGIPADDARTKFKELLSIKQQLRENRK